MRRTLLFFLAIILSLRLAWAVDNFVIEDIRVEGLQRISAGTVFNYLPVKVGDTLTDEKSADAIRSLFKTGFFKDVRLEREGNVLVVFVTERPSVSSIDIVGNKDLDSEELLQGLKQIGLAEGRVFDRSLLDKVEQELQRIYFSQGKYAVKIDTTVTPLERNRVGILIDISEGTVARIHQINIVGNEIFEDDDLLDEFELSTPTMFSFITGVDKYSKQKLSADLERLRSFYLDRGYLGFKIDSTQVSITPDKKDVYITINITEGEKYTVSEVKLAGEMVVPEQDLIDLVNIRSGDTFSRKESTSTSEKITKRLGKEGYTFANVNPIPDVNEKDKTVALTFFVDPGKRVYVRRINFTGNTKTKDEVLRREMRQLEGGWASTQKIEQSQLRLRKLGYFQDVTVETVPVSGVADQVDVNFNVTEKASGNLLAGLGYSQSQGVIFSAEVTQENFLGTGQRISLGLNTSDVNTLYSFRFDEPYYTLDGVSRFFDFRYRKVQADEANIADFSSDVLTGGIGFGIPITEYDRFSTSIYLENTKIHTSDRTPQEYLDFLADNGDQNTVLKLNGGFSHNTLNRAVFADRGSLQSLNGTLVFGDLQYYRLEYKHLSYLPLAKDFTLQFKGELGYGDAMSGTTELPFYENFLAGGPNSVRGYQDNTLGPKDSQGDPLGGNFKVTGNIDFIFPMPLLKDKNSFRPTLFFDFGNVYDSDDTSNDSDTIRYSGGVSLTWLSPFGVLTGSLAHPFNPQDDDDTENFQFTFGQNF
jgi:outer membrane protein insertion porin family